MIDSYVDTGRNNTVSINLIKYEDIDFLLIFSFMILTPWGVQYGWSDDYMSI